MPFNGGIGCATPVHHGFICLQHATYTSTTMDVQKTLDNIVSFTDLDALFKRGSLEIFPSALQQQQTVITVVLVLLGMYLEFQRMASGGR